MTKKFLILKLLRDLKDKEKCQNDTKSLKFVSF